MSIESFIELCYSFMIKSLHNFDLSFDTLSSVRLKQLKLFIYFESNLLVWKFMQAYSHNSISSLTYSLSYYVEV